ncbi:MAG: leucine-rich repeat domain-containing protein [Clostridia bacterium]|nr:leucine-rich repeat domain-containing protein [Clostridia bacterium]
MEKNRKKLLVITVALLVAVAAIVLTVILLTSGGDGKPKPTPSDTTAAQTTAAQTTAAQTTAVQTTAGTTACAEHSVDGWTQTKIPTCAEDGVEEGVCSVCGETVERIVPATDEHLSVYYAVLTKPTCVSEGVGCFDCSDCGKRISEESIPATGEHNYDYVVVAEATCTAEGSARYECTACGDILETLVISKKSHDYEDTTVDPVGAEAGYTLHTCRRCGQSYKDGFVEGTVSTSGLEYVVNSDKKSCTVVGIGGCTDRDLYIPNTIDGYIVTGIGDGAFEGNTNLTGLTVSANVASIGERAFANCTGIKYVWFNDYSQLYSVPKWAFFCCTALESLFFGNNSQLFEIGESAFALSGLKDINFGENSALGVIGSAAFAECRSLKSVEIPSSVTEISSFAGCTSLAEITFAEGSILEKIGGFTDCISLKRIVIPAGVRQISSSAFWGCTALAEVVFEENSKLESIEEYGFVSCTSLKSIDIPDAVYWIGDGAFAHSGLISIELPLCLDNLGMDAFNGCSALERVIFDESCPLQEIKTYTFRECVKLKEVALPGSIGIIGQEAFVNCAALEKIVIPASVFEIGKYAFVGTALNEMVFEEPLGWNAYYVRKSGGKSYTMHIGEFDMTDPAVSADTYASYNDYTNSFWQRKG